MKLLVALTKLQIQSGQLVMQHTYEYNVILVRLTRLLNSRAHTENNVKFPHMQ